MPRRPDLPDSVMKPLRAARLAVKYRDPARITRTDLGWLHRYRGGYVITEKLSGAPFEILGRNTADLFFYDYTPRPGDVIVELGAELGTETVFLSRAVGPRGRVISVEAHPRTCDALREVVRLNGLDNVTVVHGAVGGESGSTTISDGSALSNVVGGGDLEIPALTLRELLDSHGVENVDLLKVNIEGAERPLFNVLTEDDAARIQHAVISCHDFKADRGQGEFYRTGASVEADLDRLGFTWRQRTDHPHAWGNEYRYATR